MSQVTMIGNESSKQVTIMVHYEPWTIHAKDFRFGQIFDAIRANQNSDNIEDILYDILTSSPVDKVVSKSDGKLELRGNAVYYEGEQVNNLVVERIIECNQSGLDIEPLMKFLGRLMQNPSMHVINNLYGYLENGGLAVMPTGEFVAYKRVNSDYSSWHKNKDGSKLYNNPGTTVKVKRRDVDDNHQVDCSYGLHVGNPKFVRENTGFGEVVLLCSVPPECVVTVPDYDTNKLRTCEYTVIKSVDVPKDFSNVLYDEKGTEVEGRTTVWADPDWEELAEEFNDVKPCCQTVNTNPVTIVNATSTSWKTQPRDKYGRFRPKK